MASVAANKIPIGAVSSSFGVRAPMQATSIGALENCLIIYNATVDQGESDKETPLHLEVTPDIQNFFLIGLEVRRTCLIHFRTLAFC